MFRKSILLLLTFIGISSLTFAQSGAVKGKVTDSETGEEIPFANVVAQLNGTQKGGTATNFDGYYTIKPINPGTYDVVVSYVGYAASMTKGVLIKSDQTTYLDIKLTPEGIILDDIVIVEYVVPLIDPENKAGGTVTAEEIKSAPTRDINSLVAQIAGVYQSDEGGAINIKGGRRESTVYYVDGVKVTGSVGLPQSGIEQVSVITGGMPAQYGDATGGVISITTSGPSRKVEGSVELVTSQFLDPYGYNLASFSVGGPLKYKKADTAKKGSPIAGFRLSGEILNVKERAPRVTGLYKLKDDKLAEIQATPLKFSNTTGGFVRTSEFVTLNDMEKIKARQNVAMLNPRLSAKIDIQPSLNTNFQIGGTVDYNKSHDFVYVYSLFNPENNPENLQNTWRVYGRFTQKFKNAEPENFGDATFNLEEGESPKKKKSASNITNAFYEIQADYEEFWQVIQDDSHQDRYFEYGHIGNFDTHHGESYTYGTDSSTGLKGWVLETYKIDSITFTPGTGNVTGTKYAEQYYALSETNPTSLDVLNQNSVLTNGERPTNVYDMWYNVGRQYNDYFKGKISQFRLSANASADFKDHAIKFGVEYEQRSYKAWDLGPIELWTFMRQYANDHIRELDKDNPDLIYDGDFFGEFDTIKYDRLYSGASNQYTFDKNLRTSLGLKENGTDWIDVDNLDPGKFSLDMFSADELIAETNGPLRFYYGYDYLGNKLTKKPTLNDFFTKEETRPISAFEPIYMAGYIQDRFDYKDIKFNLGLRVDRYDANQMVLKDKYSMLDLIRVEDLKASDPAGLLTSYTLPGTIGDEYAIYVDNLDDPKKILGFRNEDDWYNSDGELIVDPAEIATKTNTGTIAPYLNDANIQTDPRSGKREISIASFQDIEPEINLSPRAAFSFPISDVAQFFAHYDVLTERPKAFFGGNTSKFVNPNRMDPVNYLYFDGQFLNNPHLRSVRTIDYQVGFKQALGTSSALSISAFYREMKDMIQVVGVNYAYPFNYISFSNIDFGTVKGFTFGYDMRRRGNIRLTASYTLQFADGTGSSASTGFSLVAAGLPNLRTPLPLSYDQRHNLVTSIDYRYGTGKEYNGPRWFGKPIFQSTGANIQMKVGSGTPYSKQSNITPEALLSGFRRTLKGSPNSARKPWRFLTNVKFDRNFNVKWGKGKDNEDAKKESIITMYLQIQNLFNTRNVLRVYRATGNAGDDGYLASAAGQRSIATQLDEEAYVDLYNVKVASAGSQYSRGRTVRLGVIM
ncbi:MAG: carboxypeptidase-like regulatory domain-containing protein, partial [Bacteroidia bacterium]|nr:carboxypeptidase-like regulatory domain-containing protein [Bacteroidia bacterium]